MLDLKIWMVLTERYVYTALPVQRAIQPKSDIGRATFKRMPPVIGVSSRHSPRYTMECEKTKDPITPRLPTKHGQVKPSCFKLSVVSIITPAADMKNTALATMISVSFGKSS